MRALLLLAACDDPDTSGPTKKPGGRNEAEECANLEVTNYYAESLFGVSYRTPGGQWIDLLDDQRLDYDQVATVWDAFTDEGDGAAIDIRFGATSLGTAQTFPTIETEVSMGEVYAIGYDYDTATGGFSIDHGWHPEPLCEL